MSEQPSETSIEKSVESSKAFQDKSKNSEDVHVTTACDFDLPAYSSFACGHQLLVSELPACHSVQRRLCTLCKVVQARGHAA